MKFDKVFVDADSLLYSIGYMTQRAIYHVWVDGHQGDPSWISTDKRWLNKILKDYDNYEIHKYLYVQPFLSASITIDQTVDSYKQKFETDDIAWFFTGEGNFREKIATIQPYKENRDDTARPRHYEALKAHMIKRHSAMVVDGEEADDAVAIGQSYMNKIGKTSIIVSIDKDLNMVPGWHYNPKKKEKEAVYFVDELEGQRWFYTQLLMGDEQVDNIPGLPGLGIVRSKKLLENCESVEEMERIVGLKYACHYDDPESAMIEVGRLLWMRTDIDEYWLPRCLGGPVIGNQEV